LATETPAAKAFTEDDVAEAVKAIIAERSKDGVFTLQDSRTGAVHPVVDKVRLGDSQLFVCTALP